MPRAETKFEDCADCANRLKPWICRGCDVGEHFQERGESELDLSQGHIPDDESEERRVPDLSRLPAGRFSPFCDEDDDE